MVCSKLNQLPNPRLRPVLVATANAIATSCFLSCCCRRWLRRGERGDEGQRGFWHTDTERSRRSIESIKAAAAAATCCNMRRPSDLDLCGRQPEAPHNPRPVPHSAAFNFNLNRKSATLLCCLLLIWPRCFLEIYLASATASDAALLLLLLLLSAASSYALALAVAAAVALGSCMLQVAAAAPQSRR